METFPSNSLHFAQVVTFKNDPASFLSRFLKNPLLQSFDIFQSSYGNVELCKQYCSTGGSNEYLFTNNDK